jgi:hypothetical protein
MSSRFIPEMRYGLLNTSVESLCIVLMIKFRWSALLPVVSRLNFEVTRISARPIPGIKMFSKLGKNVKKLLLS